MMAGEGRALLGTGTGTMALDQQPVLVDRGAMEARA
jgi:hypothetical protein